MKEAYLAKKIINVNVAIYAALYCFWLCACGMEEYYVLNNPVQVNQQPNRETEYANRYFDFNTRDTDTGESFNFYGTAIFYKIFNNYATVTSNASRLNSLDNSTSTSYGAAAKEMIDTYKYQQLRLFGISPGLNAESYIQQNSRVYIRLTNYGTDPLFAAKVIIGYDGTDASRAAPAAVVAYRNILGNNYTFDFGRGPDSGNAYADERNRPPNRDDADASLSGSGNTYYVDMYAVAVGRDTTYTTYYSKVLHLGAVAINAGSVDN